jgi:hypothetical protein
MSRLYHEETYEVVIHKARQITGAMYRPMLAFQSKPWLAGRDTDKGSWDADVLGTMCITNKRY